MQRRSLTNIGTSGASEGSRSIRVAADIAGDCAEDRHDVRKPEAVHQVLAHRVAPCAIDILAKRDEASTQNKVDNASNVTDFTPGPHKHTSNN